MKMMLDFGKTNGGSPPKTKTRQSRRGRGWGTRVRRRVRFI